VVAGRPWKQRKTIIYHDSSFKKDQNVTKKNKELGSFFLLLNYNLPNYAEKLLPHT
jgi:hypothetical protein